MAEDTKEAMMALADLAPPPPPPAPVESRPLPTLREAMAAVIAAG